MTSSGRERSNVLEQLAAEDKRIRAAMGKAVREVRRHAKANKIKLGVANARSWAVPK